MTPFKPGDIVKRINYESWLMHIGDIYTIEIDTAFQDNGDWCISLVGYTWTYDRIYFELVAKTDENTNSISTNIFKVWDIVIRNSEDYWDPFMKKWKACKITSIHGNNIMVEWSGLQWSASKFNRIKFKFNVWDIVQSIRKDIHFKKWTIHTINQNWSHFYFKDKNWNQSLFNYRVSDFELVAEVKDINSNNDGYVTTVSDIKAGDYVRRDKEDYLEVKQWLIYKVYDTDKDGDLKLMIDWERSTYIYRASLFTKVDLHLHWTSCPPTLIVGDARSVGATGDSNSSNPITPMSKTFNDYAVEAFMSNEENRTAATNARNVLQTLVDNLDLSIAAIEKIKRVVYCDFRDLNGAMEDSDITTIAKLVAENPAVKEFVERFMENTLVEILPEPVVTSTSIQDKFK